MTKGGCGAMHKDEVRALAAKQFEATLQQSAVKLAAIPSDQLQVLVNAVADSIFAVLDAWESEDEKMTVQGPDPDAPDLEQRTVLEAADLTQQGLGEELLWRGRPYLTVGTRYELTSQRLRIIRGILGNTVEEIELVRVRDTKVKQHAGERLLNVGDVTVISADPLTPEFVLSNVREPLQVREMIRAATLRERNRRKLYYREDLDTDVEIT